jgi:putative endonuclease
MDKIYFVYIMTNKNNTVLYTGFTNNLIRRIYEHKQKLLEGFTKKYNCSKLILYEQYQDSENAILIENQRSLYRNYIDCFSR